MGEGIGFDALGAGDPAANGSGGAAGVEAPAGGGVSLASADAVSGSIAHDVALRQVRMMIRSGLPVVPNMLAVKWGDARLALSPDEIEAGTDAYTTAVDVLCPDLEKLTKFFAIAAVVMWTGTIFMSRLAIIGSLKRGAVEAKRKAAAKGAAPAADDVEDAEAVEGAEGGGL